MKPKLYSFDLEARFLLVRVDEARRDLLHGDDPVRAHKPALLRREHVRDLIIDFTVETVFARVLDLNALVVLELLSARFCCALLGTLLG